MKRKPKQYAIASCTREATSAGVEIASNGGNAVDVAVGVAFALMVSNVLMCSVGGGGFATIRSPDGQVETIDFFDCMPGKGLDEEYLKHNVKHHTVHLEIGVGVDVMTGHATAAVPGSVKGLELLLKRHGTMPLKEVLQPAIEMARNGVKVTRTMNECFEVSSRKIHWRTRYGRKLLATPTGEIPEIGYLLKQTDLANTLELIADYGSNVVYRGHVAEAIIEEMQDGGGLITLEDLESYEAIIRKPIKTRYRGKLIWTNPPPSVGGPTLIELLHIASFHKFGKELTPQDVAILGQAQRLALHDKYNKYIDPETNEEISKELLSLEYAANCYKKISPTPHTTHTSCIDDTGYAVGITMSMGYDSGAAVPGTGILLNNTLGEMELNPQGYLKAPPGQRLTSGMAPTIMYDESNNELYALGSPGASRISTCLMQSIINIVDFNMDLLTALSSPRFHYEDFKFALETDIEVDENLLDDKTMVCRFDELNMYFGGSQCVRLKKGKLPEAAADPRRSGSAQTLIV